MKWCPSCKTKLNLILFSNSKARKDGKQDYCKPCSNNAKRKSVLKKKSEYLKKGRLYSELYRKKNREKYLLQKKHYREKNKELIKKKHKEYIDKRRKIDKVFNEKLMLRKCLSRDFFRILNKNQHYSYIESYLGISMINFIDYIRSNLKLDMTWDNYGKLWEFGHVIPLAKAKTIEEVRVFFQYKNIVPEYKAYNNSKLGRTDEEFRSIK